jgi:hypothetical protein
MIHHARQPWRVLVSADEMLFDPAMARSLNWRMA